MGEVKISLERYEELIRIEDRVNVTVETIINKKYICTNDILRILGTEDALLEAARLEEESERREKEWNKSSGFAEGSDADV